jgi:hypothetical protein
MFPAVVIVAGSGYNRVGKQIAVERGEAMGIRFFCPNGHKLNVKDFQAGQTGICPFCGVKMPIPLQSTRRSSKRQRSLQQGGDTVEALASQTVVQEQPRLAPANRAASRDPLTEAGDVVWYVHPPSGGQFGPAAAEVMRAWIAEGRISVDSLVWHEGWRNWQTASKVFPQLSLPAVSDQEPDTPKLVVTSVRSSSAPKYHHKRTNTIQIVFVVSLTMAVIVLFFILRAIF